MEIKISNYAKVMRFVFEKPEKWVHIRNIAKSLNISPNTARAALDSLFKEKIIEKRKIGNLIQARANLESEDYKTDKKIENLRSIYKSGIVDYLYDYYSPQAIVLFGSYSRGEDTSESDVDIGIITSEKKRPELMRFEKKIGRKISLSLFARNGVSDEFFTNIMNGIVLKGVLK